MILKALYDYYHRSGDDVAPFGLIDVENFCALKTGV